MHTAYLIARARKGIPLKRWGVELTVLLEKIIENNFVHRLQAICLLKAVQLDKQDDICKANDRNGLREEANPGRVLLKERK